MWRAEVYDKNFNLLSSIKKITAPSFSRKRNEAFNFTFGIPIEEDLQQTLQSKYALSDLSFFSRVGIAYLPNGLSVGAYMPRLIPGPDAILKEGTINLFGTINGSSQDWTKWGHYNNVTYWYNNEQYDDPVWGKVFRGVSKASSYIFQYTRFELLKGIPYTISVFIKADRPIVGKNLSFYMVSSAGGQHTIASVSKVVDISTEFQLVEATLTPSETTLITEGGFGLNLLNGNDGIQWEFAFPMMEPFKTKRSDFTTTYRLDQWTPGPLGKLLRVEEGVTNLLPLAKQKFEGWSAYSGAIVSLIQNQIVPEWQTTEATRIKISGGTSTLKYTAQLAAPSANGQKYTTQVYIKNIGTFPLVVMDQLAPSLKVTVNPGETRVVEYTGIGNGSANSQIRFETLDITDTLDFIAWHPLGVAGKPYAPSWPGDGRSNEVVTCYFRGSSLEEGISVDVEFPVSSKNLRVNDNYNKILFLQGNPSGYVYLGHSSTSQSWVCVAYDGVNPQTSFFFPDNLYPVGTLAYFRLIIKAGVSPQVSVYGWNSDGLWIELGRINNPTLPTSILKGYLGSQNGSAYLNADFSKFLSKRGVDLNAPQRNQPLVIDESCFQFYPSPYPEYDLHSYSELSQGNIVRLYDGEGIELCHGQIINRDITKNPWVLECTSRESLLKLIDIPHNWSYQGNFGSFSPYKAIDDLKRPFRVKNFTHLSDFQTYVDIYRADIDTHTGNVLSAVETVLTTERYYPEWYITFQIDMGINFDNTQAPRIRWTQDLGSAVGLKVISRMSPNGVDSWTPWSSWVDDVAQVFPEEVGVTASGPYHQHIQVKFIGTSKDISTQHPDKPDDPLGFSAILQAFEVIWREKPIFVVNSALPSEPILQGSLANPSPGNALGYICQICEKPKIEFEMTFGDILQVGTLLGRDLKNSVILIPGKNCNLTRLQDDVSSVYNHVIGYGKGSGIDQIRREYFHQESIDRYGLLPTYEYTNSEQEDPNLLYDEIVEIAHSSYPATQSFSIEAPPECPARLGDTVLVVYQDIKQTARIVSESRDHEKVSYELNSNIPDLINTLVDLTRLVVYGKPENTPPPPVPSQIAVKSIAAGISISWNGVGDFFILRHKPDLASEYEVLERSLKAHTFQHTGLTPSSVHYYGLTAVRVLNGRPMLSQEYIFSAVAGDFPPAVIPDGSIQSNHISDSLRQRVYSSNNPPLIGTLANLYDGIPDSVCGFPANTTLTIEEFGEQNFVILEMDATSSGIRYYAQAENLDDHSMLDIHGSLASPKLTKGGVEAPKLDLMVKSRKTSITFLDPVTLRNIRFIDAIWAAQVYAERVCVGLGQGMVLRDDEDFAGLDARDSQGNTFAKFGREPNGSGGYRGVAELRSSDGKLLVGPTGALLVGQDGTEAEAFVRSDMGVTPDSYIIEGLEIQGIQTTVAYVDRATYAGLGSDQTPHGDAQILATDHDHNLAFFQCTSFTPSPGKTISKVVLRVYVTSVLTSGSGYLLTALGGFNEADIFGEGYSGYTVLGTILDGGANKITSQGWLEFDVTGWFPTNGPYSVKFSNRNVGAISFASDHYPNPALRPHFVFTFSGTSPEVTISAGKAMINGKRYQFPPTSYPMGVASTSPLFYNKNGQIVTTQSADTLTLGMATSNGSAITGIDMSPSTGRRTGTYNPDRFMGNWKYWDPTAILTLTKPGYVKVTHNLNTMFPTLEIYIRKQGGTNWYGMAQVFTGTYERGQVWRTDGPNAIRIQAGQDSAFFAFTDSTGVAEQADSCEIIVRVERKE